MGNNSFCGRFEHHNGLVTIEDTKIIEDDERKQRAVRMSFADYVSSLTVVQDKADANAFFESAPWAVRTYNSNELNAMVDYAQHDPRMRSLDTPVIAYENLWDLADPFIAEQDRDAYALHHDRATLIGGPVLLASAAYSELS